MNRPAPSLSPVSAWFCLRSQPKHEHIAAIHLRTRIDEIDVFCPRLRIRKQTRRGAVWFVEALFPGYLFARFNPADCIQTVKSTPGISAILRFGLLTPSISDDVIRDLRAEFDKNELHEVNQEFKAGDEVTIGAGPFLGLKASVIRVLPAAQRVQVLLEVLGRSTPVELSSNELVTETNPPRSLARSDSGLCWKAGCGRG